jgi:beta-N-acetylhexosaminidase
MPCLDTRRLPLAILAALPLWIAVPGALYAAVPDSLQEALGAPPPAELAPPPGQNPFKKPLGRSAPFIGVGEEPMRPLSGRDDPPGRPLPMTGTQGPQNPRMPQIPAPKAADGKAPVPPTRNSAAQAPPQTAPATRNTRDAPGKPALSDMIGQMIMVGFNGFDLREKDPLLASIQAGRAGNSILFERGTAGTKNIESPGQVRLLTARLQKTAPRPLCIAVVQEGGRAQALTPERGFEGGPAAAILGRGGPDATRAAARRMGLEMAALGINFDFAPVADLQIHLGKPFHSAIAGTQRSFGANPELVAVHVIAFGEGLAQAGVAPCLKHFPGCGSAGEDVRDSLPDISATWRPAELIPFQKAIQAAWPGAVMPGRLHHRGLDALQPAGLSAPVLTGLLRGKMGFTGVIISDDMQRSAPAGYYSLEDRILLAVEAGVDILLFGNNSNAPEVSADEAHAALLRLVRHGRISPVRIEESFARISRLKQRFAGWKP